MNTYILLIIFSLTLLGSFLFNQLQRKYQISSVIMLTACGMILQFITNHAGLAIKLPDYPLKIYGTLGLLIIVLEAVMDMEITHENRQVFGKSIVLSSLTILGSIVLIATIIAIGFNKDLLTSAVYATPMAIVSSAIVIPSMQNKQKSPSQELLILESIFSDIIGILLFNFLIMAQLSGIGSLAKFAMNLLVMLLISIITTLFLAIPLSRERSKNIHVVILASLILIYSIAECFHLSALILILFFGLTLRNLPSIMEIIPKKIRIEKHIDHQVIQRNLANMQEFIDDLGFIIRSMFFVLFGYSIQMHQLLNIKGLLFGSLIITTIYVVRYLIAKWLVKAEAHYLTVIMGPRGLITILLFLQIPDHFRFVEFQNGIVFFVVITSSLIMTYGLIHNHRKLANQ